MTVKTENERVLRLGCMDLVKNGMRNIIKMEKKRVLRLGGINLVKNRVRHI